MYDRFRVTATGNQDDALSKSNDLLKRLLICGSKTNKIDPAINGPKESEIEEGQKGRWLHETDGLFAQFSYSYNVQTLWALPYFCSKYGGFLFFIPFILVLIFCTIPLHFLEMFLGQYSGKSELPVWSIAPFFKGVGIASLIFNVIIVLYNVCYLTWTFHYFANSLTSALPWANCSNLWATSCCSIVVPWDNASLPYRYGYLLSPVICSAVNNTTPANTTDFYAPWRLPADEYFHNSVLSISPSIERTNNVHWPLVVCLIVAWVLIFLILIWSVKILGIVSYVSTILPIILLLAVFICALTQPGGVQGLANYLAPIRRYSLGSVTAWGDAGLLAFASVFPSWSPTKSLASFNRFHSPAVLHDAYLVPIGTALVVIVTAMPIACLQGVLATQLGVGINNLSVPGMDLIFVTVAQGLTYLPAAAFWSAIFYLALSLILIGTIVGIVQSIVTSLWGLIDKPTHTQRMFILLAFCCAAFLVDLIFSTKAGLYISQLFQNHLYAWPLLILAIFELNVATWIYGFREILSDTKAILGFKICPNLLYLFFNIITEIILWLLLIYSWASYVYPSYGDYWHPKWSIAIGWLLSLVPLLAIPIHIFYQLFKKYYDGLTIIEGVKMLCSPDPSWGPAIPIVEQAALELDAERVIVQNGHSEPIAREQMGYLSVKISATEPAMKRGKINRGTQITREVGSQVDENTLQLGSQDNQNEPGSYDKPATENENENNIQKNENVPHLPPIKVAGPYESLRKKRESKESIVKPRKDSLDVGGAVPTYLPPLMPSQQKKNKHGAKTHQSEGDASERRRSREGATVSSPPAEGEKEAGFEYENPNYESEDEDLDSRKSV